MNSKRLIRTLALLAAVAAGTIAPGVKADVLSTIAKTGTIKIAVPQDFPPFGSVGADMKPTGYDIDVANLIGKELGAKVELVPVSSANRVPFLTTGKVDLVISSMGKNAEREKVIDFSAAYAPFFNGVFGPEDIKAAKAEDLAGKTISVTRGSIEDLELSKIAPTSAVIKRFEDNNATITAYLSGQTQLIATGNVVAAAVNERSKLRRLSTKFLIKNSPCYVGLAKGESALQAKLDEIIAKAKKNGSLNEISQRWLHAALPGDL
ncbi:transporter substrate-binding domain-containing protein [Propionivibrio soli]|uniref:transporter substrate-binding domain-containing protein n=1 Tax=Propionivibrio soli TaxID=2976531 RepID=UPI0021E818FA|nr:transporter substrate-binding domain-containing protein [Propionivibrio soli]